MTDSGLIAAAGGTYIVNNTTEVEKQCAGIYVIEETVFLRIEANGATGTDVKTDYIQTPATSIKAGTLITPIGDQYFSAVTLTSGSVALILGI